MDAPDKRAQELAEACRLMPSAERRIWLDAQKLDPQLRSAVEAHFETTPIEIEKTAIWARTIAADDALGAAPAGPRPDVTLVREAASLSMIGGRVTAAGGIATGAARGDATTKEPTAPGVDPMVGKTFAGVEIERIIGSGGMGRVYLGLDTTLRTRVALKVLLRTQRDESVRKRFDREARLLEKLRHPAIAAVLRTGVESDGEIDTPYIVMEYVSGVQNVSDFVFRERLGTRETVELFLQVCDGVGFAHHEGYIHRDLKPPNILVDRHGRVKVIDFGVARAASLDVSAVTVRTQTGQIVGTMQYMSPEQFIADPRQIDKRSDVYALGAVLFELLTGVQPHDIRGMPVHEAARTVCERDAPDIRTCNPRIDDKLAAIVQSTLAREKAKRPEDAIVLGTRLRGWMRQAAEIPDRTIHAAHPDREFAAQTGVESPKTAIIMGVGGGGGGVHAKTPTPAGRVNTGRIGQRSGTTAGGWALIVLVTLLVVGGLLVAFDVISVKQVVAMVRNGIASATGSGGDAAPEGGAGAGDGAKSGAGAGGSAKSGGGATGGAGKAAAAAGSAAGARKSPPANSATAKVSEVRVLSAPAGAEVTLAGQKYGRTPALVPLPDGPQVRVDFDLTMPGYKPARIFWKAGTPPIVAANLEPLGEVSLLPRIFTLEVGPMPAGAVLRLVAPDRRDLGAGTWCAEVPFHREAGGWAPRTIELQAVSATGAPLEIEMGMQKAQGSIRYEVRPADAATHIRVRVR